MAEQCLVNTTGMTVYEQQNQELADFFLNEYLYKAYSYLNTEDPYSKTLELIISPRCNLGCKYCYVHKYRKDIFSEDVYDSELTLKNLDLILRWLEKNKYNPELDIFSGEPLAQEIGFQVLEAIYEYEKNVDSRWRIPRIMIPTNFTFICSEELTKRVDDLIDKLAAINIELLLSASFDGKYMEQNRPFLYNLDLDMNVERDDAYYDRVFEWCKKHCYGFHPMIYSKGIKDWKKNFLWFQDQFKKFDIPWDVLYLLHVRNEEWTAENVKDFQEFVEFLFDFAWEKLGKDPRALVDWIIDGKGFNLLGQPFVTVGRGLTCSIQNQFTVRVSDLMCYPCHRTGYKDFYFGQFVPDEIEILKYHNTNVELLLTTYGIHKNVMPYCMECPINNLCAGQCLGAQYESNGNLFVPIPSVCIVSHALVASCIKGLEKYHAYGLLCEQLSNRTILAQLDYVKKEICNNATKN